MRKDYQNCSVVCSVFVYIDYPGIDKRRKGVIFEHTVDVLICPLQSCFCCLQVINCQVSMQPVHFQIFDNDSLLVILCHPVDMLLIVCRCCRQATRSAGYCRKCQRHRLTASRHSRTSLTTNSIHVTVFYDMNACLTRILSALVD